MGRVPYSATSSFVEPKGPYALLAHPLCLHGELRVVRLYKELSLLTLPVGTRVLAWASTMHPSLWFVH